MMKRIGFFLLLVGLGIAAPVKAVTVSIADSQGQPGSSVDIPIQIDEGESVAGFQWTITFDPAMLEISEVQTGSLTAGWAIQKNMSVSGQVQLMGLDTSLAEIAGGGSLAVLSFTVVGSAGDTSALSFTESKLSDADAQTIAAATENGTFTVSEGQDDEDENPTISGAVFSPDAQEGLEGVTITFSNGGGTVTTNGSGEFSIQVPVGWSGTATPAYGDYRIFPPSWDYDNVTEDLTEQPFVAFLQDNALAGALDNDLVGWLSGLDFNIDWCSQTAISHDGVDAAQSGVIDHEGESVLAGVYTAQGPGTISFWWKVSSETGCDTLIFSIDRVSDTLSGEPDYLVEEEISGEVDWQEKRYDLDAGLYALYWVYGKDSSGSSGSDCGWVDQVVWNDSSDTTPDQFTFTDQTGVSRSTTCTSNSITVSGINAAASISISEGTYSVNGGPYISSEETINNDDTVRVKRTSSSSYSATRSAKLNIGGVSDTFSVTTKSDPGPDTICADFGLPLIALMFLGFAFISRWRFLD